ncbi:hypothetical protein ABT56_18355 [Photobacterium aquae]|uniref:Uncharacterized protein n=2 Tax=Photobacterium aquae TaxID=1195763 RepID=A0A0J1GVH8_9GAMM|nr:hypothetical protein ABT56_18355 [Photobacterium aquae]
MCKNEDVTAIDEILSSSRIQKVNPFSYAIDGVLSEWIQLLLVIERIKADKSTQKTLQKIAGFTKAFLNNDDVDEKTCDSHACSSVSYNPVRPSYDAQRMKKWGYLHYFFVTLDEGMKDRFFLSKVAAQQVKGGEHDSKDLLLDVIPELCDVLSFSWDNLNEIRMNYPHSLILRGVIEGNEILRAIENLIRFDNDEFQSIRYRVVSEFIGDVRRGYTCYPKDIDFNQALKYRQDLVRDINEKLYQASLSETVRLIREINISACLWIDNDGTNLGLNSLLSDGINLKPTDSGVDIYVSNDLLLDTLNMSEQSEFISILMSKLYGYIKDNNRLSDDAKEKINQHQYTEANSNRHLTKKLVAKVNNYNSWIFNQNNYILNKNNDLKISKSVIVRGIKFSIWYDDYLLCNKKNTLNGATEYSVHVDSDASPLTIKQSYEFVKRFSTKILPAFIYEQTKERLYDFYIFDDILLKPLNVNMFYAAKSYVNKLDSLFKCDNDSSDFDSVLTSYKAVKRLLSESDSADFDYVEAYEMILSKKYEVNFGYYDPISSGKINMGTIKRSKFESLLKFNLDVF